MVVENVEAGGALAGVQRRACPFGGKRGLPAVDHPGVRIGFVHGLHEGAQQPPIFLRVGVGVPVGDVRLVPQRVIVDTAAEAVHHPLRVANEGGDLLRRFGWPEHGI